MAIVASLIALMLVDDNGRALPAILGSGFILFFVIVGLALLAFQIYCCWRVAEKCGYQGVMSLWLLVPIANIVVQLLWVFSEWPIETEVKRLRASRGQP